MGFPWNRRSTADQQGGIPIAPPELVVGLVLSGVFSGFDREDINERRMSSCTMIWVTGGTAVGVCPGYDDFLVWLHPQTEGAMAVPMTAEAVDDFSRNVLPAINAHRAAHNLVNEQINDANVEWLLSTCNKVRDEKLSRYAELPPRPRWDEMPGYAATDDAYESARGALSEFLSRHDDIAVPDLV